MILAGPALAMALAALGSDTFAIYNDDDDPEFSRTELIWLLVPPSVWFPFLLRGHESMDLTGSWHTLIFLGLFGGVALTAFAQSINRGTTIPAQAKVFIFCSMTLYSMGLFATMDVGWDRSTPVLNQAMVAGK